MRQLYSILHATTALLLITVSVRAQDHDGGPWVRIESSPAAPAPAPPPTVAAPTPAQVVAPPPAPVLPAAPIHVPAPGQAPAPLPDLTIQTAQEELAAMQKKMEVLNQQMAVVPTAALQEKKDNKDIPDNKDDKLKTQVEL